MSNGDVVRPDAEEWAFLAVAGREINKDTIRNLGQPIRAFAELVVGSDEAAIQVLASDSYDVGSFVGVMERLVATGQEEDLENFDRLADFVQHSKDIYPKQYPDLVEALSLSVEPLVRGTSAFSLPPLARIDTSRAVEVWSRLLTDTHPRVLQAAIITWRSVAEGDRLPTSVGPSPFTKVIGFRDRRHLKPLVRKAEARLADIGRPMP